MTFLRLDAAVREENDEYTLGRKQHSHRHVDDIMQNHSNVTSPASQPSVAERARGQST